MKHAFLAIIALTGLSTVASAAPVICASQSVVTGLTCSLGSLTFNFEQVTFLGANSGTDALGLEAPPTGIGGVPQIAVLGFQLLATYPVDIHLLYSVTSTSANIVALNSTFTPAPGPPPPSINESACGADPFANQGACTPAFANVVNTTGNLTFSNPFGPKSQIWIDKDVTDPGFSSFTDGIQVSSGENGQVGQVPEPSTGLLFAGTFGLGLLFLKLRRGQREQVSL